MAEEQEVFLREIFDRWNRGDLELDDYWDRIEPDVVIDSSLTGSEWHGHDGVRRWLAEIAEQFETWTLVMKSVTEQGAGVWLIEGVIEARGRRSGVDLETPVGWVVRFRDGRIYWWGGFLSPSEAEEEAAAPGPEER